MAKILDNYNGKFAVQSFSPLSIYWFKKNRPKFIRGQLSKDFSNDRMLLIDKIFLKNMYLNFLSKPDFISYDINAMPNKYVKKYREKNNIVLGWTVNDIEEYKKGMKYCDNMICDDFNFLKNI